MANIPPKADAYDFSRRLREAMKDCGMVTGRGAGPILGRRYGVSTVNANAWLKGEYRPDSDRAKRMAEDFGVRFEWLYFGTGSKNPLIAVADEIQPYRLQTPPIGQRDAELLEAYRDADLETRMVIDRILGLLRTPEQKKRKI